MAYIAIFMIIVSLVILAAAASSARAKRRAQIERDKLDPEVADQIDAEMGFPSPKK